MKYKLDRIALNILMNWMNDPNCQREWLKGRFTDARFALLAEHGDFTEKRLITAFFNEKIKQYC